LPPPWRPAGVFLPRRLSGMRVQRRRQIELRAPRGVGGAEDAARTDKARPRRVPQQRKRRIERRRSRDGDVAIRSTMSHAEGVAGQVSRQRVQQRTAAAQIDGKGRVRAIKARRGRGGGVCIAKLEDVAFGERIEDAAIGRGRRVVDPEFGGRGAEEARIFARRAAQLNLRTRADFKLARPGKRLGDEEVAAGRRFERSRVGEAAAALTEIEALARGVGVDCPLAVDRQRSLKTS